MLRYLTAEQAYNNCSDLSSSPEIFQWHKKMQVDKIDRNPAPSTPRIDISTYTALRLLFHLGKTSIRIVQLHNNAGLLYTINLF
jgi:hypothetical protein